MAISAPIAPASRSGKRSKLSPTEAGLPDPRPVTDYSVEYRVVAGKSEIEITLAQPCIIRRPNWRFISCDDGGSLEASAVVVKTNTAIVFGFDGIIDTSVAFVDVPYQDMEVQNFQGGFVRPGGQWFRAPK